MRKVIRLGMILLLVFLVSCTKKPETKTVEVPVYTEVPVDTDDHLTISNVNWSCEEWLGSWLLTVTGKAQNTGTCILEFVEISIKGYDSGDNVVATGSSYIDGGGTYWTLTPGQSSTWSVTDYGVPQVTKVTVGYSYEAQVYIEPLSIKRFFTRLE